jgi:hypothetical protein
VTSAEAVSVMTVAAAMMPIAATVEIHAARIDGNSSKAARESAAETHDTSPQSSCDLDATAGTIRTATFASKDVV